jgi:hypothetical protein
MPTLNVWGNQETYKTSAYFYAFSLKIKASPEDRQKILSDLKKNGMDVPAGGIQKPASALTSGSTDSLVSFHPKTRMRRR